MSLRSINQLLPPPAYVQDSSYPVHYSSCTVIISVSDVNDVSPTFKPQEPVSVLENQPRSRLLTVGALDGDLGDNGRLTYMLMGESLGGH